MTSQDVKPKFALPVRVTIRLTRIMLWCAGGIIILALGSWSTLAIRFSNLPTEMIRLAAAVLFAAGWIAAFVFLKKRLRTALAFLVMFVGIVVWWKMIPASHDRNWTTDVAVLPSVTWSGDEFTVHNVRNFEYRSVDDFDVHYEDRTYNLNDVEKLDFVMSDWGLHEIVHTMLSFGFADDRHLVLSIETRREKGEVWSGLRGLFRQYEVIYILADERDLLGLRTNIRSEDVYVLPMIHPPEKVRIVLRSVLDTVNDIAQTPRFYNTILHNCTTGLLPHLDAVRVQRGFDIRILKNGYIAEIGFENGTIDTELSYEEAGNFFHINQYVEGETIPLDFSERIRPY